MHAGLTLFDAENAETSPGISETVYLLMYVSRFSSKKPAGLSPTAGLFTAFPGFSAVLPASWNPADDMGERPSKLLSLGMDCPVDGPDGCLCMA